jgi:hypothetical protein
VLPLWCTDERDAQVHQAVIRFAYTGQAPPDTDAPWLLDMVTVADKLQVGWGVAAASLHLGSAAAVRVANPPALPRAVL